MVVVSDKKKSSRRRRKNEKKTERTSIRSPYVLLSRRRSVGVLLPLHLFEGVERSVLELDFLEREWVFVKRGEKEGKKR